MSDDIYSRPECVHAYCSQPDICGKDAYCAHRLVKLPCDPAQRFSFKKVETPVKTEDYVTGTWYLFEGAPWLVCPECHHRARLGTHAISADGTVNPSIVCPMASCGDGVARCTAHYYGRLEGWVAP